VARAAAGAVAARCHRLRIGFVVRKLVCTHVHCDMGVSNLGLE
jgi:hypothetical protein